MTISGLIDWGGIAFGAELPTGMCWLVGEDGNHYTIASAGNIWTIGCAETNSLVLTIDQTRWRTDLASLLMGTSGTYNIGNHVIATGTQYFGIMGYQHAGGVGDMVCVYYRMVNATTATIVGGFFYKSALVNPDGINTLSFPVMGTSTLLGNKIYAAARVTGDHILGNFITPVLMELPDPTATTVDTSPGSWGTLLTQLPWTLSPSSSRQYGGLAAIIPNPAGGIRVYSYFGAAEIAAAGGTLYGLTTPGMLRTICAAGSNDGITDVSADFGMPFADVGYNFNGTFTGNGRNDYTTPQIGIDGTSITFARTYVDSTKQTLIRRFSQDAITGNISAIDTVATPFTSAATAGTPEWVQAYFDGSSALILAGRDTHRLLLGEYDLEACCVNTVTSCCDDPVIVDEAVIALLEEHKLLVAHLVKFDFVSEATYLWNGHHDLITGGHTWKGLRKLGGIDGLEDTADLTATQLRFTLSGVDGAVLAIAIAEDRTQYVGRLVTVWLQFFDSEWQPVGDPIARACGLMDGMPISRSRDQDGGSVRILTLTAENIFSGRGIPPAGNYTDPDQKFRSPGDRGLEFVSEVQNTVINVPW